MSEHAASKSTTVRLMTEAEAWAFLAEEYGRADERMFGIGGICGSIGMLYWEQHAITEETSSAMMRAIEEHAPPIAFDSLHRWDFHDRASRAAFCREMAAKCRAESEAGR